MDLRFFDFAQNDRNGGFALNGNYIALRANYVALSLPKGLDSFTVEPLQGQVNPPGVLCGNESILLAPFPPFELLLASDGGINVGRGFIVNQHLHIVFAGMALGQLVLVLIDPPDQVAGNADVDLMPAIGHYVDVILPFSIVTGHVELDLPPLTTSIATILGPSASSGRH